MSSSGFGEKPPVFGTQGWCPLVFCTEENSPSCSFLIGANVSLTSGTWLLHFCLYERNTPQFPPWTERKDVIMSSIGPLLFHHPKGLRVHPFHLPPSTNKCPQGKHHRHTGNKGPPVQRSHLNLNLLKVQLDLPWIELLTHQSRKWIGAAHLHFSDSFLTVIHLAEKLVRVTLPGL